MPTVADLVASTLKLSGIETIFGLPGGENVILLDAFRRHGQQFILARHETSAVFMASATAQLTRRPAACLATLGPGATNTITGVAHAFLDRSPVLVITAQQPLQIRQTHSHQILDLQALFAPITKASIQLQPDNARSAIVNALKIATSDRPGPVHLELTNTIASQESEGNALPDKLVNTMVPRSKEIDRAKFLLKKAQKPIIICGLGLEPEGPYDALQMVAESLNAPVIVTPKAIGCLPANHPLFAGAIGLTRSDPVYEIVDESDCVVAIGFDVVELVKPWSHSAPLIWVAPWLNGDPKIPVAVELVGKIRGILLQFVADTSPKSQMWGATRIKALRLKSMRMKLPTPEKNRLLPQEVLAAVRDNTPDDAIVVTDVGSHKIFTALNWPAYTPNSYLVSNGLSAMGYGLPAAAAAGLCHPERTIVAFLGDGGLAMTLGELALIANLESTLILIVFCEGALDLIRAQQIRAGFPAFGTSLNNPNFRLIAEAFGLAYHEIKHYDECVNAVRSAAMVKKPTFIEVKIDPAGYPTAPAGRS